MAYLAERSNGRVSVSQYYSTCGKTMPCQYLMHLSDSVSRRIHNTFKSLGIRDTSFLSICSPGTPVYCNLSRNIEKSFMKSTNGGMKTR